MNKKILAIGICVTLLGGFLNVAAASSKNKQLTKTPGFFPVYSPDSKYFVYSLSDSDGKEGPLYRKKAGASSKSKGTKITDDSGASPVYSPDGNYIVYVNTSHDNYLYKKNANDDNDGDKFVETSAVDPTYSPDGKYVVYSNADDEGRLYRKEVSNTDSDEEGDAINDANSQNPIYTSDGEHIYYINTNDSKIYKKDSDDDEDGTVLGGSVKAYSFTVSPSGTYIVYSNVDEGGKLYKRKKNDSGKGKKINDHASNNPFYFPGGNKLIYSNADKKLFIYSLKVK